MRIEIDDAIEIYAQACRKWYGGRARHVALKRAKELRLKGDYGGGEVWEKLASEIERPRRRAAVKDKAANSRPGR